MSGVGHRRHFGTHLGVIAGIVGSSHQVVRREDTDYNSMAEYSAFVALDIVSAVLIGFAGMMFGKFCSPCLQSVLAIRSWISDLILQPAA
jgi:hypothetical protein